jgi:hypothetical protein
VVQGLREHQHQHQHRPHANADTCTDADPRANANTNACVGSNSSSAYSVVIDVSATFTGADWPYFTLEVDGTAVSASVPVNTTNSEPTAFSLNLTNGVAHTIQISAQPGTARPNC